MSAPIAGEAVEDRQQKSSNFTDLPQNIAQATKNLSQKLIAQAVELKNEVLTETINSTETGDLIEFWKHNWQFFVHVPYVPALSKPGWLLRYIIGPHTFLLFQSLYGDFFAGITVAMTLIPQAISYASLANVPSINGLYTSILPGAAYVLFGTSMHLGLGPVALVSILTGQLVVNYGINYTKYPQDAVDFTGEAALAVGTIFCILAVLNLGDLINFVSHPVMSGFTTAAASLIGLSQLGKGFGFTPTVPQTGQAGYDYNYQVMQWFIDNWDGTYTKSTVPAPSKTQLGKSYMNHFSISITFALYFPLLFVQILRNSFPATPARMKSVWFNIWQITSSIMPFIALIIGTNTAWSIKNTIDYVPGSNEAYYQSTLKVVGAVPPGLNFFHSPKLRWNFGQLLLDVLPLALVAFMESFSVAHRIASQKNELHFLNASQELFANGVANFMSSVSSGYPVAGSFSRSSLNAASGSKTAMSKAFTISIMVITLNSFSQYMYYIPNAALTAIIWASIYNLMKISDIWQAWKHNKKDFFVMIVTLTIVFVFNTGVGLAVGIGLSIVIAAADAFLSEPYDPVIKEISVPSDANLQAAAAESGVANAVDLTAPVPLTGGKIELIQLSTALNFVTITKLGKAFITLLYTKDAFGPAAVDGAPSRNDELFFSITSTVDSYISLPNKSAEYVEELPSAVVVDFKLVRVIDLTALIRLKEIVESARAKKVKVVLFNVFEPVAKSITKFGIRNDRSTNLLNLEPFLAKAQNILLLEEPKEPEIVSATIVNDAPTLIDNSKDKDIERRGDIEELN